MGSDRFFFPFFWKDFQFTTARWTDEQVGAYLRLLIVAWDAGGLPLAESDVQRLGSWSMRAWRRIWPVVGLKWEARDGRLVNARQEEIRAAIIDKSTSSKASADRRWEEERRKANEYADAMRTHPVGNANKEKQRRSVPPPTPPHAEGRHPTRAERKATLRAVGPPAAAWRDDCPHQPPCSTETQCWLLTQKAEQTVGATA